MADFNLIMPKMGESIMEATILRWLKKPGDMVALDETILEIATDKVDSEIPSPVAGRLDKIIFQENDVVPVGQTIAVIATEAKTSSSQGNGTPTPSGKKDQPAPPQVIKSEEKQPPPIQPPKTPVVPYVPVNVTHSRELVSNSGGRFYSPLVRNIASSEGIPQAELDQIEGTGHEGRVTKSDILNYLQDRTQPSAKKELVQQTTEEILAVKKSSPSVSADGGTEIIEMDRMRKLIAEHMVRSKHTSPHVTSFVEVDVTEHGAVA